jgi:chromosome segregation ATPase
LVLAQSVFVKRSNDLNKAVFAQLEALEEHDLGRKLLDTIALQLNNKAPLADIAKMLQQLRENLVLNQQEADMKHAQDEVDCETEIYQYNRRIDFASNEIQESTQEIQTLTTKVAQLEQDLENKIIQLDILNEQEAELTEQRAKDAEAFKKFDFETEQVIDAVEVIIQKLSTITPDAEVLAALTQLNKIGKSNPILALMQVASTFSAEQLDNVINKLGEVNQSLVQALADARQAETQAQLDFEALMVEIAAQRESISAARIDVERQLTDNKQALDLQKKRKEDATAELHAATAGKEQKEAECEAWRTQYAQDTEHRQQEISIIRQVEEILATKLSNVKVYLQERSSA